MNKRKDKKNRFLETLLWLFIIIATSFVVTKLYADFTYRNNFVVVKDSDMYDVGEGFSLCTESIDSMAFICEDIDDYPYVVPVSNLTSEDLQELMGFCPDSWEFIRYAVCVGEVLELSKE